MKKIIVILLVMMSFVSVNAKENDTSVTVDWVPNVYYNYKKNGEIFWGQFGYIYANGEVVYCLDLYTNINEKIYNSQEATDIPVVVLTASYFGYGYDGNTTLEDYMATQELIWNFLGYEIYWTTESNSKGQVISVANNKSKINKMLNSYGWFPNFDSNLNLEVGRVYEIYDLNNLMNEDYLIHDNTNNDISHINNGIRIKTLDAGNNIFVLERVYKKYRDNIIYTANNSQRLLKAGYLKPLTRDYNYYVKGANLIINAYNIESDKENKIDFSKNVFELYDQNNKLVTMFSLDEDGKFTINNLSYGDYILKHTINLGGYEKHEDMSINISSKQQIYSIYLKPIYRNLNIKIQQGISKINYLYPSNEELKLYKDDEFIKNLNTNDEGVIEEQLIYGNYTIYGNNYKYEISTNDFSNDINIEKINNLYCTKLIINIYDEDTLNTIDSTITLNNKKYISKNGKVITDEICEGEYEIIQDKIDNYEQLDNINIEIDSESKFYLKDNEVYLSLDLYNKRIECDIKIKELPDLGIFNE